MRRLQSKTRAMLGTVVLGTALAMPASALAADNPQGLYSAEGLLDAEVYTAKNNNHIGEIDDIVLDNDMTIRSFVVETNDALGLGGKAYVVRTNNVRVQTAGDANSTEPDYRVTIDLTAAQLEKQPVYSDSWWNKAKQQANQAWQHTKNGASSAWTHIKKGSKSLYESAKDVVHSAAESAADATSN